MSRGLTVDVVRAIFTIHRGELALCLREIGFDLIREEIVYTFGRARVPNDIHVFMYYNQR